MKNKVIKRLFAGALIASMILSGCGGKQAEPASSDASKQKAKVTDNAGQNGNDKASETDEDKAEGSETDAAKNAENESDEAGKDTGDDAAGEEEKIVSEPISDEEKDRLMDKIIETTGSEEKDIRYTSFDDFDGNGNYEGFAFIGNEPDEMGWCEGTAFFVNDKVCSRIFEGTLYLSDDNVFSTIDAGNRRFVVLEEAYVTSLVSYVYYVDGDHIQESDISRIGDINENGDIKNISITISVYDCTLTYTKGDESSQEWMGHSWKPYYFYYDSSYKDFKEYVGTSISKDELEDAVGFDLAKEIEAEGYQVDDIYKRENGIINVNYSKETENADGTVEVSYDNANFDQTTGKFIGAYSETADSWKESDFGGIYEPGIGIGDVPTLSEEELNSPIEYSYQNHPMELFEGDTSYATANYYTIELDKSDREKFSRLQSVLDRLGSEGNDESNGFFSASVDEIREMFSSGWGLGYEHDQDIYPIRSDGRVFSFIVLDYTYMAGAHGYTFYLNHNYDPASGKRIAFSDVVKDYEKLPEIIVSDLEKQNDDLVDYFKDCPSDRENLLEGIPQRLENNASGLAWAIDYDGIWVFFEDYAMGCYAAGARNVKIKFADHPEIFTEKYNNYKDGELPVIGDVARQLKDANTVKVDAASIQPKGSSDNESEGPGSEDTSEEGYGEDWWYHAVVTNPGWSAWTAAGVDMEVGNPSFELSEVAVNSSDWLDRDAWAREHSDIPLPEAFPYNDGTYSYSAVNNAEGGELSLTVMNTETQTLVGNFYFDEFINAPNQGEGLFADFTEPSIQYAVMKDDILYVSLGHRTYAAANPHKSYIVAIDTISGNTLWRSDDQVCGSYNFVILGDSIYCGYGFTDEPDYIYILNCKNGKVQKKIKAKSAPYDFIVHEGYLYVLTYNTEYKYKILE